MNGSEHIVRLQVVSSSFSSMLRDKAVPALILIVRARFNFDVHVIHNCSVPSKIGNRTKALASLIVVAINDIERAMRKVWICEKKVYVTENYCVTWKVLVYANLVQKLRAYLIIISLCHGD